MNPGPVFLDSGIFIAFLDASDAYHEPAVGLFADPPRDWRTSLAVLSETYSWILHRMGESAARSFRLALADFAGLRLLPLDLAHHSAALRKLEKLRGHKLTYVDASSLVFVERGKIREVWGTDQHLGLEGARVLPGAPA